jgi:hypothetical protein
MVLQLPTQDQCDCEEDRSRRETRPIGTCRTRPSDVGATIEPLEHDPEPRELQRPTGTVENGTEKTPKAEGYQ